MARGCLLVVALCAGIVLGLLWSLGATQRGAMINIIVALIFLIVAVLLLLISQLDLITIDILDRLDKIASILTFLLSLVFFVLQPITPSFDYRVQVQRRDISIAIFNAEVIMEIPNNQTLSGFTDSNGMVTFSVPTSRSGERGRLTIAADGYRTHIEEIALNPTSLSDVVQLEQLTPIQMPLSDDSSSIGVLVDRAPSPLDVMIVIDNSCSMFPKDTPQCRDTQHDNDPDFLRIGSTSSFIARLGFGESNESDYRLGTISFGEEPALTSPLRPLAENRDDLIRAISSPAPQLETQIVPALKLAYRQLREAPKIPNNQRAIVLITDGYPYPSDGQSEADIEKLIGANTDISLFIILLQKSPEMAGEFRHYIEFWERLGGRYTHVFTFRIESDKQIAEAYGKIVSQVQNTISSLESIALKSRSPRSIFVSKDVKKITLTFVRKSKGSSGKAVIIDPKGDEVSEAEAGVLRLQSKDELIEIISISAPRLRDDLKDASWTVLSDAPAELLLDRKGRYRIRLLAPSFSLTDTNNVYLAIDRHNPDQDLILQFDLEDDNGNVIIEPQPIQGNIIYPSGTEESMRIPADIQPDACGVYTISFSFMEEGIPLPSRVNRFAFMLKAGLLDSLGVERIPVAVSTLYVDVNSKYDKPAPTKTNIVFYIIVVILLVLIAAIGVYRWRFWE